MILAVSFLSFFSLCAQDYQSSELTLLGDEGLDVGNYVIPVSTGGYLSVGYFAGKEPNSYTGAAVRLDAARDTIWTRSYRAEGDNRAWSVAECPNGDFIIAGFTNSFKDTNDDDVWVFRIDSEGNLLWEKNFGGIQSDLAWDIQLLQDGNYVVAAQTGSKGAGNLDAWLLKIDGQGNVLWDSTYGSQGRERIFSITQGVNGSVYATGIFKKEEREDPIDVYTICVNPVNGELIWEDYFDKGLDDTGHGVIFDKRGGVWVAGYTTSVGKGSQDGFLLRYLNGEVQEFYTYGGGGMDRFMTVVHGTENDLWLIGYSESYGSDFDVWITRTNADGDELSTKTLPAAGLDRGVHMLVDSSGLLVVGTYNDESQDPDYLIWKAEY